MNRKLLSLILLIATCSMLVQSRTNTITCDGNEDATGGQTCCPVEDVFEPDYSPLDPTWDCDGESYTFVALPEAWEGSSQQVIKELIESIWNENWSLLFSNENFRCIWFPGCEIAELAVQDEDQGIYTLRCRTCHEGYRRNDLGICEECTVDDCIDCSGEVDVCLECVSGYFLGTDGANCANLPGCQVSNPADAANDDCTTCMDGYFKDGNGDCESCDTGYITCSDIDVGIVCDDYYFLNQEDACVEIEYCESTTAELADSGECEECMNGFYPDGVNGCAMCDTGYTTCSALNVGIDCDEEYFLDTNDACVYVEYCESTTDVLAFAQECEECMTGSFLDVGNVCTQCSTGYITCTAADQGTCDEGLYYFDNGTGGCVFIDDCLAAVDGTCVECAEEYHFAESDGYCEVITGCAEASIESADSVNCDVCDVANNYFIDTFFDCVHLEGCTASDSAEAAAGNCQTCDNENNWFLETDGDCVHLSNCIASDQESASQSECDECDTENDFFLQTAGTCVYISDCQTADVEDADNSECTTCDEGYWNDDGDCTWCDTNNYWFWQDEDTCFESVGCESATAADLAQARCSVCEDGYYLDTGACVMCPAPYTKCSDATTPIQCDEGYNLIGDECREIDDCCIAVYDANANPTTTCTQCFTAWGYLLSEGQCVDINDDDCTEGTDGNANTPYTCTRCDIGYELENNECVSCGALNTLVTQADCEACRYSWIQDQCVEDYIMTCIVQDDTTGDCIVCNYGSNWDAVSRNCLPCASEVASWWDDAISGETESFTALETCTISTWVAPEPPADGGDSGDNGDNAYSMIFNMIALVVLSLCAFFIV